MDSKPSKVSHSEIEEFNEVHPPSPESTLVHSSPGSSPTPSLSQSSRTPLPSPGTSRGTPTQARPSRTMSSRRYHTHPHERIQVARNGNRRWQEANIAHNKVMLEALRTLGTVTTALTKQLTKPTDEFDAIRLATRHWSPERKNRFIAYVRFTMAREEIKRFREHYGNSEEE